MKVEKIIPEVYYKESRDFAYISRLIEILFNYMKTGADNVSAHFDDESIDNYLLKLIANNLGFKLKHDYNNKNLISICNNLQKLYKAKGTKESIKEALQILINSQKIKQKIEWNHNLVLDENDNQKIILTIPEQLGDTILIEDLFEYILPAGMLYKFVRVSTDFYNTPIRKSEIHLNIDDNLNTTELNKNNASSLFETLEEDLISGLQTTYLGNIGSTIVAESIKENEGGENNGQ